MNSDLLLYYAEKDIPANCSTFSLIPELGQIKKIFADKTGTLTRNQMQFRKCSIGGKSYGEGYTEISLSKAKLENQQIDENLIAEEKLLKDKFVNFVDPHNQMQKSLNSDNESEKERVYMFWKGLFLYYNFF